MQRKMQKLARLMGESKLKQALVVLDEILGEIGAGGEEEEQLQRGLLLRDKGRLLLQLKKAKGEEEGVRCLEEAARVLRPLQSTAQSQRVRQASALHLGDLEVSLAVRQEDDAAKVEGFERAVASAQQAAFGLQDKEERALQVGAVMHKRNALISLLVPLERFREATDVVQQMNFSFLQEKNLRELGVNLVRTAALWEQQGQLEESELFLHLAVRTLADSPEAEEQQSTAAGVYLSDFRERYEDTKKESRLEEGAESETRNAYCHMKVFMNADHQVYWSNPRHIFAVKETGVHSCSLEEVAEKVTEQLAKLEEKGGAVWLYSQGERTDALLEVLRARNVDIWHCGSPFRLEQQ